MKAVLALNGVTFERTHNLMYLLVAQTREWAEAQFAR